MNLDEIRHDYLEALEAWHVAWTARADWHRTHFAPPYDPERPLITNSMINERRTLKEAEDRAYALVLRARDALAKAIESDEAGR